MSKKSDRKVPVETSDWTWVDGYGWQAFRVTRGLLGQWFGGRRGTCPFERSSREVRRWESGPDKKK